MKKNVIASGPVHSLGALSAALLGVDGDGAAEAPEHHPEDEHQDGVEGDQEVPLPQPASHIDFVATA